MTLVELEHRMSGGELIAHIAEMKLSHDETVEAHERAKGGGR